MMNDYPLCESVALYIDNELAAYINLAIDGARNSIPAEIADIVENGSFPEMAKNGTLPIDYCSPFDMDNLGCYCTEFDGTISPAFPEKGYFNDVELDDDFIRYVPASRKSRVYSRPLMGLPKSSSRSFRELLQNSAEEICLTCRKPSTGGSTLPPSAGLITVKEALS